MKNIGLFIGTERGYVTLKELVKNSYPIGNVLVLEQQKHEISKFTEEIIRYCRKNKIKHSTTKKIKPKDYKNYLTKTKPDILFVISWRFLISKDCFTIPKFGIYILHDSLLPKYRSFSPTNWVIINGEKKTGLTLQYISKNVDSGDIVDQIELKIEKNDTATILNKKFIPLYSKIILRNIKKIENKKNKRLKQKEYNATYGVKRIQEDGKIDLQSSALTIERLIKGLSFPYPGAYCLYHGKKIIVWEADKLKNPSKFEGIIPGKIVSLNKKYCDIMTGDGILRAYSFAEYNNPSKFLEPNSVFRKIGDNIT